ncbi:3(or 17)beta-hydroxysteroid dehydrogenase [Panacagrimonas perspica]|uniref:3(Or 17)beta-hydroxysteroid dehydrogenase n=1 Tax=Panacagrimonas perspica TaxID=381431 RepID=A0A4R7PAY3_9GAMM|nr:SDR family oxidoreductase [Panacagrimonas perspica]TDU31127.1 3(or 17)beta-hydroxysteroid dehydrogenase [Panacagrimonas perspica]THD01738.1 short-chain dehydrogenase [Panacagrimonas perspica]
MGRVSGKVALITGAASGVGKADALLLAREGARVVLTDVNEEAGRAVAADIGTENALFVRHDISSEEDWIGAIKQTQEHFGGLDILVNNAAILAMATIEDTTLELWQKVQRVNSDGYFLGCKYGLAAMRERPSGSIVNMSSMAGIGGQSSTAAYSASKGAVAALTRSVAAHCRAQLYPIRCNSVHPDGIMTPMVMTTKRLGSGKPGYIREKDPKQLMARMAKPEDIANLVLFLASDESRFVNGAEMRIDNGYLMWAD